MKSKEMSALEDVLKPSRKYVPLLLLLGLLSAILEGVGIGLVIPLLHLLTSDSAPPSNALSVAFAQFGGSLEPQHRAVLIVGVILALFAVKNLVLYAAALTKALIYGQSGHVVRMALVDRLTHASFKFLASSDPGRLLNILSNESWRIADAYQARIAIMTGIVISTILTMFLLLVSWQMTLAVGVGMAILQGFHQILSRNLRASGSFLSEQNSWLATRMLHVIHSARLIRVFGRESYEEDKFFNQSENVRKAVFNLERRQALIGPVMEQLLLLLFMAIVVGAWTAGASFPTIVAFLLLLYRLQPQIRGIQGSLAQLDGWTGAINEVSWLLGAPRDEQASRRLGMQGGPCRLEGDIVFDRVSVTFDEGSSAIHALKGVSFRIAKGRATAIVGASGSGKTTIVNLLCRLIEPQDGKISIGGAPLADFSVPDCREAIAIASQDLELFDDTIHANIAYGREQADDVEIIAAAKQADIHDFISGLPDGYSSRIGYRGELLSAGQRQRLVLARALLRKANILIMDEATNALDALSEERITAVLQQLSEDRTLIVISHHLSTIRFCQDVILLNQGEVSYAGSLGELKIGAMEDMLHLASIASEDTDS